MFIQEVILDGFKSYAQKTVISGFDPQFNAITGLNGTGKSNILDSICFVLGITNLSQVRVGNLQELVYKQGQAGITKATVTVVFNNSDPTQSPVGYESHKQITITRQIVIGGKNKYMINGHTVQQNQVQNLLHSVQLNVNNPHFLIMQGRITRVLNMKPPEILSMLQEASGTRMFETKKEAAIKTIEKKQLKVNEITACMNEEILPTLDNLRSERQNYITWQSNNSEVERLERLCVAYEYKSAQDILQNSENDREKMMEEITNLENIQNAKQNEVKDYTEQIKNIEELKSSELYLNLAQLKKNETEISKELVKLNTLSTNSTDTFTHENENLSALQKQLENITHSLVVKENELNDLTIIVNKKQNEYNANQAETQRLREKYQNACAGVADDDNTDMLSIPEQIATWEKKAREADSQIKQLEMVKQHILSTIKENKQVLTTQQDNYNKIIRQRDALSTDIQILENKVKASGLVDKVTMDSYFSRMNEFKKELVVIQDNIGKLEVTVNSRLSFQYSDPMANFDRSRVKGLIKYPVTTTALEIASGNKLYQLVVDNEQTGKLLLENGKLKNRVTILPLNKLNSSVIDSNKMTLAKSIANQLGGTADLALDLITFSPEVSKAMQYVFGNTIICSSSDIAKTIAFDNQIRVRTVTYDGDSFDPNGTITGGAKNQLGTLLLKIYNLQNEKNNFVQKNNEIVKLQKLCTDNEQIELSLQKLIHELEIKKQEYLLLNEKISTISYTKIQEDIANSQKLLESHENDIEKCNHIMNTSQIELSKLSTISSNSKKSHEKIMKEMENSIKSSVKVGEKLNTELVKIKQTYEKMKAECQVLSQEKDSIIDTIKSNEKTLNKLKVDTETLSCKLSKCKEDYEKSKQEVLQQQQEISNKSKEIKNFHNLIEKCNKVIQNSSLDSRKLQHKLKQWDKEIKDAEKSINQIIKSNSWIEKEKQYFGLERSDYDFKKLDVDTMNKRLKQVKLDQDKLSKKINKKVMGMIERAEAEYEELRKKKEVILNDKTKIETVIQELDIKKAKALQTTWTKVNRDFGSIFSMLLPGTEAKLEPPEGETVNEGLEVKVAFNGVWKDSLTELSGGQRSLLALSLILALLLFKPAPMYILDEVDAALDLSHTQNIGLMLKTHFSKSQFIVVSLKEGMFNNANVIFRTKFIDGVSNVIRTVMNSGRGHTSNLIENNEENDEPMKKKGKNKKVISNTSNNLAGNELTI